MFGTKSKSWEYENEIRLIYSTSKRKGYNPFALKSIYFGLNMDEMHQIQIIEGLTNRDIRFHYCPVKILDLEINRVDNHPLGR